MHNGIKDIFGEKKEHPAFGLVGFSRFTIGGGRQRFFGSPLSKHHNGIMLRIHRASEVHDLSHDDQFAEGAPLIEVEMSESQFASLLTTMNMGEGVPCTIRFFNGKQIDELPEGDVEIEKVRKGFEKELKQLLDEFEEKRNRVKELLGTAKPTTKEERKELMETFEGAYQDLKHNYGFILEQFSEAAEKVVGTAKAEVDAFVSNAARISGLEKIKELGSQARDGGSLRLLGTEKVGGKRVKA